MTTLAQTYASDVAFTPAVKAIQARKGSRHSYARVEQRGWRTEVDENLEAFLADGVAYEEANKARMMESLRRQAELNAELDELEERWLELHEQLEQIN